MSGKLETIADVVNDMKALTKNSFTSSPTSSPKKTFEDDSSDISIDDSNDKTRETTPVKSDNRLLKSLSIDANENNNRVKLSHNNGLLTFSTPNMQQHATLVYNSYASALQYYRHLMQNSTPKSVEKPIRKPKVNFHSIDDIVNGGKSDEEIEHNDSGYQSNITAASSMNITNTDSPVITKSNIEKNDRKPFKQVENNQEVYESDNETENDENQECVKNKPSANSTNNNNNNKKIRTTFSDQQKWMLEQYFRKNPYPDPRETEDLSRQLNLAENVIKVWFQNKRSRDKQRKFSKENNKAYANEFTTQLNNLQFYSSLAPYAAAAAANQIIGGFY